MFDSRAISPSDKIQHVYQQSVENESSFEHTGGFKMLHLNL